MDIRISVSGIRGKSTAVRWLNEILLDRTYDTYAKVTGVVPTSIYNGTDHAIDRPAKVRLYENERQLRRFGNIDAAIVENQGIRPYSTRLVNASFVQPHVVFITNVRADHLDTLGGDRLAIARALARSVPAETTVVTGESDDRIVDYLAAELARRDAPLTRVEVPEEHASIPGAEIVYGLNPVLAAVGESPVDETRLDSFLERLRVAWFQLPSGRVFNAAPANDVQSTELIRRQLVGDDETVLQPLVYLRADRRGRTSSFLRYLNGLAERGLIEQARVVGDPAKLFARHATFPVVCHDDDADAAAVLDAALEDGWPVVLMTNTVAPFMERLVETIETRAEEADEPER